MHFWRQISLLSDVLFVTSSDPEHMPKPAHAIRLEALCARLLVPARVPTHSTKIHTPFPLPLCVKRSPSMACFHLDTLNRKDTINWSTERFSVLCCFVHTAEPTRCNILPFNGSHHPRLEEPRKKNRSGNPLSGRGIGERRARGVHSLRSHWSVGGA